MTREMPPTSPPDDEPSYTIDDLSDINELAAKEFIRLLNADQSLAPEWKNEMLSILEKGVPGDISPLKKLITEDLNATTQETNSTELPRDC